MTTPDIILYTSKVRTILSIWSMEGSNVMDLHRPIGLVKPSRANTSCANLF